MIGSVGQVLTTAPQQGSPVSAAGKVLKWLAILLVVAIVLVVVYFAIQLASYDWSFTDYAESEWGVNDTGENPVSALFSAFARLSPVGVVGGFFGLGTTATGTAGMAESVSRGKDSFYTWLKRLSGN